MKRYKLITLTVFIGLICGCASNPTKVVFENPDQIQAIKTIAVFPFACNRSKTGQIITDAMVTHLEKSRFAVIDPTRLQQLLREQGLTLDRVAEDHRPAVGKLKGVDAIITGSASVRAFGGYTDHVAESTARMIDMSNGEILLEVNFASGKSGSLRGTTPPDQIGKEFAKQFSSY